MHIREIYSGISLFHHNSLTSWRSACSNLTFLLPKIDIRTVTQLLLETLISNETKVHNITLDIYKYDFIQLKVTNTALIYVNMELSYQSTENDEVYTVTTKSKSNNKKVHLNSD